MGVAEVAIKAHKQNNIRGVLALIRSHDTFSVAEISHQIKLSKTTVKKTIDLLTAMKLVVSAGKGESTEEGGKKPELYRFNRNFGYVISLHVTPDAIIAMTADLCANITHYQKTEVTRERELGSVLDLLVEIIRGFTAMKAGGSEKLIGIVIALPGLADSTKGISIYSPHYPSWGRDVPFTSLLREKLGAGLRRSRLHRLRQPLPGHRGA